MHSEPAQRLPPLPSIGAMDSMKAGDRQHSPGNRGFPLVCGTWDIWLHPSHDPSPTAFASLGGSILTYYRFRTHISRWLQIPPRQFLIGRFSMANRKRWRKSQDCVLTLMARMIASSEATTPVCSGPQRRPCLQHGDLGRHTNCTTEERPYYTGWPPRPLMTI